MFQGNWKCSTCGGPITELPFEPRSESGLTCRTCYAKSKGSSNSTSGSAAADLSSANEPAPTDGVPDFDEAQLAGEAPDVPDLEGASPATAGERKMHSGDWQCATCGGSITSLPFEPRTTSNLKCIDCFKASKG